MDCAFLRLDKPVARIVEAHQTAIDHANGMPRLALPGVFVFELQFFDWHIPILAAFSPAGPA
jgi:hypothetical protein